MRLLGKAVLLCLCMAASSNPAFAATPGELDSDTVINLAGDFSDFFVRVGSVGLWQQIQVCYKKASASADTDGIAKCIILDEAGKALDDNYVRAVGVPNRQWYQDAAFTDRMRAYSQAAFGDENAYGDFWEKNKKAFGTALRKLNVLH